MAADADPPHSRIATQLAIRLVIVFAVGGVCTVLLLPGPTLLSVPLILVVNLFVLWFTVHYVFAALNALLETKLERLDPDRAAESSDSTS